jgi:hypothetical protein
MLIRIRFADYNLDSAPQLQVVEGRLSPQGRRLWRAFVQSLFSSELELMGLYEQTPHFDFD